MILDGQARSTAARTTRSARSRSCRTSSRASTARCCSRAARRRRSSACTLGTPDDEQIIDGIEEEYRKNFYLHYNFPPYSVGETRRIAGPGRREIGHGMLAERALAAVLPPQASASPTRSASCPTSWSRTASSSMASVCGGCLVDDARRRAAHAAGGGHRDGPRHGRRARRDPLRHPRLGGPPRRHGLQGRRLGRRHHRAADGHQDQGRHRASCSSARSTRRARAASSSCARCSRPCRARSARSPSTRRAWRALQIPAEKIGFLIGPGGKNIKAMQEQYKVKISVVDDDGQRPGRSAPTAKLVKDCATRSRPCARRRRSARATPAR